MLFSSSTALRFALVLAGAAFLGGRAAFAGEVPAASSGRPFHELVEEPRLLALTPGLSGRELTELLDRLEARGAAVPVAVAGTGLVVVRSAAARSALAREPAVAALLEGPSGGSPGAERNASSSGLLRWWNEGFASVPFEDSDSRRFEDVSLCAGATTLEEALLRRGAVSRCGAPPGSGRIHFASGRVVVNLILPESEGAGTYSDWSPAEEALAEAELVRALHWWNLKSGGGTTFVLVNHGTAATSYEAGTLLIGQEELYLSECLASLGFGGTCGYAQIEDLNAAMNAQYGGSWGFTQVILHANVFPGSTALAYAYLGGPHTVALLGNGPLGGQFLDRVVAHEMGHIFQALDEYSSACSGCEDRSGYLNERNGNCASCATQIGKCIMRGSGEYDASEMNQMESRIEPCTFTKGQVGIRDANSNGILDVRETRPETEVTTGLPDTLTTSRNFLVEGRAWDLPYAFAPPRYPEPVTLNTISTVEFSVDGRGWSNAAARDGFWTSREEGFEFRLPAVGGGAHRLLVRAMNSVLVRDPNPVEVAFFVHDVVLLDELELVQDGADLVAAWRVNGEDFGSTYFLYRREHGGEESLAGSIVSRSARNDKFRFRDEGLAAAREYIYRLEVDIPGLGPKALGTARATTVLADPPAGRMVAVSPNPTARGVLVTVTVPRGPRNAPAPPPGDDDGPVRPPPDRSSGGLRGESDPPPRHGDSSRRWRPVDLCVFDLVGRRVRSLGSTRELELTRVNRTWDGRNDGGALVSPGIYFLRTVVGESSETTRITVVR